MTMQVIKVILAGVLAGIALFLLPFFLIRAVLFFLLIGTIIRLVGGRRRFWGHRHGFWRNPEYAQRWRNMTPEERRAFKDKMEKEFFSPSGQTPASDA